MALLEGKTSTERNKIIAAGVLGVVALLALFMAFGPKIGGSSTTTVTVKTSPTPARGAPATGDRVTLPTAADQKFWYETTPVEYRAGGFAPDPGRNIFAFYEPGPPCKDCPVPTPKPTFEKPATPAPTPPLMIAYVAPQSVYAGSAAFRLEVNGDRFVPNARIYFNQREMPTVFINEQKLVSDIPADLIAQEGPRQIIVQTPDGTLYSNQSIWTVQAPPKPDVQYIGMIGRKRYNNDTAYFTEASKPTPFGARLNDVVAIRFRLIDISPAEVVFEDVNLGFKHRVPVSKAVPGASSSGPPVRGIPAGGGFTPFDPASVQNPPGIPANIPRYVPPVVDPQVQETKKRSESIKDEKVDVDDAGVD